METQESPLKKYRRQPKIYIELPSKGKFSPPNTLYNNTYTELAVFSMTANDEIGFKTPDAMINGVATANSIKSCIPSILNAWAIPTIDIDTVLIAMRIASYGPTLTVTNRCPYCKHENQYDVPLQKYLDHYARLDYNSTFTLNNFTFYTRPLNYKEWTDIQKRTVSVQRAMSIQSRKIENEDEKNAFLDKCLTDIQNLNVETIITCVDGIEVDGVLEQNKKEIVSFLQENDLDYFKAIKKHIENNNSTWQLPSESVVCEKCEKPHTIRVSLDQSDFFEKG
jgi:hypothetical protein